MTESESEIAMSPPAPDPLLGEWACLGILYSRSAHGWAVAKRLRPDGDVGRVWTLSRPLTYRSLDQLGRRNWIDEVGREPGDAGPNRTILAATRAGRARFRTWTNAPVGHLRDLRSELLLKLVLAGINRIDTSAVLDRQRSIIDQQAASLESDHDPHDIVDLWRIESTAAAKRFVDRIDQSP